MKFKFPIAALLLSVLVQIPGVLAQEISVIDDLGRTVKLVAAAKRIVSLAPHTTELLFAAGAGDKVVGVVSFSDYPEQAKNIVQIGGYQSFDLERILALSPDLIVGWSSGNPEGQLMRLQELGLNVYITEPRNFMDIPVNLERLGKLAGTEAIAKRAATDFRTKFIELKTEYKNREKVTVFYQIWNQPLMTINDRHLIGKVIKMCGGENIFGKLSALAPQINIEAVLKRDPQAIVVTGMGYTEKSWLKMWERWSMLQAIRHKQVFVIDPDTIQRHTPRILIGAETLCKLLDQTRKILSEVRDVDQLSNSR